uniref:Uncharacterized protein n=1 Tax=Romanomermis culicivorax TaxID=13658 RepID=A0A915HGG3_ROMCU
MYASILGPKSGLKFTAWAENFFRSPARPKSGFNIEARQLKKLGRPESSIIYFQPADELGLEAKNFAASMSDFDVFR